MLGFCFLVGIGRSGVMIGSLCASRTWTPLKGLIRKLRRCFLNFLGSFLFVFWPLGVGFPRFWPENRIPHEKLHIYIYIYIYRQLGMSRIQKNEQKAAKNHRGELFSVYGIRTLPYTGKKVPPRVFGCFFFNFLDSRHAQLSIYAVLHEESHFQVKNKEIRRPEVKT